MNPFKAERSSNVLFSAAPGCPVWRAGRTAVAAVASVSAARSVASVSSGSVSAAPVVAEVVRRGHDAADVQEVRRDLPDEHRRLHILSRMVRVHRNMSRVRFRARE